MYFWTTTWTNLPAHHGQKAAIEPRDAISLEYPFERAKGGPSLAIQIVTVIYGISQINPPFWD